MDYVEDIETFLYIINNNIEQIFKKYGFERFGPKYCYNDIIVYGKLARTDFVRTDTICRGADKCDFKFIRYKKDEQFERTKSV